MTPPTVVRSAWGRSRRTHRLVPAWAQRLRSREILLSRGRTMPWHSTQQREELLVCLAGRAAVEVGGAANGHRPTRLRLRAGQALFLAAGVRHRILNDGRGPLRYLYVTG